MSMINTGMKSFPMVVIFMPLADAVCAVLKIFFPLKEVNNLILGENILTMSSKDRSNPGCGCSIVLGAM